jgi:hypothetical protein
VLSEVAKCLLCDVTAHGTTRTDSVISRVLRKMSRLSARKRLGVNVVLNYRTVGYLMSHNCNVRLTL